MDDIRAAYKMRREENIALLRENGRLKKQLDGVFPVTEKETLERTDFITDEYRNRITGSRVHAPFPAGIVNARFL